MSPLASAVNCSCVSDDLYSTLLPCACRIWPTTLESTTWLVQLLVTILIGSAESSAAALPQKASNAAPAMPNFMTVVIGFMSSSPADEASIAHASRVFLLVSRFRQAIG